VRQVRRELWKSEAGEEGTLDKKDIQQNQRHKLLFAGASLQPLSSLFPPCLTHLYHGQLPPLEILKHYTTSRIYTKIEKNKTKQKMCVKCVNKLFSSDVLQISLDTGSCVNYIQYVRLISYKM